MRPGRYRGRAGGFTLIESLLVTVMFLLALGLIGTLFVYGSRFTSGGAERTDLAEVRLTVADTLRRALAGSTQSGNTAFYRGPGASRDDLVLCLISTLDANGQPGWDAETQKPLFRGYRIFYRDAAESTLKTFRVDIAETSVAAPLDEMSIRAQIGAAPTQTLAVAVDAFQLFSIQDGSVQDGWSNPLGLRLVQGTTRGTPISTDIPFKFPTM